MLSLTICHDYVYSITRAICYVCLLSVVWMNIPFCCYRYLFSFVFLWPAYRRCFLWIRLTLALFSSLSPSLRFLHFRPFLPAVSRSAADELYAQKLKYKAISEELDHALNDMTSM